MRSCCQNPLRCSRMTFLCAAATTFAVTPLCINSPRRCYRCSHPPMHPLPFPPLQEYKEVHEAKDGSGVSAELVNGDFTHWKGQPRRTRKHDENASEAANDARGRWRMLRGSAALEGEQRVAQPLLSCCCSSRLSLVAWRRKQVPCWAPAALPTKAALSWSTS